MPTHANLIKAKAAKNDEFYTQLADVSKEVMHYKKHFDGKTVLCNCDDPTRSAFWKYFHLNFEALGLKKLISTHYDKTKPTYAMEYTGGDDNDIAAGVKTPLKGNGDFRNKECLDLLDECDIVVTNPPFSLFREYADVLTEHDKKFLIIGNVNAIAYNQIFSLLKENKAWLGCNRPTEFSTPDGTIKKVPTRWFTNLGAPKWHEKLILRKEYPKYDNYDAINVDRVADIPCDYDGVMGVPISFMDKYNPDQFELVAVRHDLTFTRDGERVRPYTRILVRPSAKTLHSREMEREFDRTIVSLCDLDCRNDLYSNAVKLCLTQCIFSDTIREEVVKHLKRRLFSMIQLDELKPILEPLLSDENAADVIASIQAIDTHTADSEVKAAVDAANAEWGKKFKDTFFGKASADDAPDETDGEPDEEPDAEDVTLDDLIYPDGK